MNLTLHIMGKDYRCLWPYLTLFYVLLIFHAVLIGLGAILAPGVEAIFVGIVLILLMVLVFILKICVLAVIVARLVQSDSTVGSTAFWLSRPVARGRLLLSKSLFLVLTVILPVLLVESGILLVHGVLPFDTLRSVPQIILPALLATLALMMLASLTSSLHRMVFLGVLAMVALVLASFALGWLRPVLVTMGELHPAFLSGIPGAGTGWMASLLLPLGIVGAVVWYQFLTRRTAVSRTVALVGLLLAFLLLEFFPGGFLPAQRRVAEDILDSAKVSVRVEEGSLAFDRVSALNRVLGLAPEDAGLESGGGKQIYLKGRIGLDNLPSDLYALPGRLSARLVLPSGETLSAEEHQSPRWLALMMSHVAPFLGFSIPGSEEPELFRQALGESRFLGETGSGFVPPSMDLIGVSEGVFEHYRAVKLIYSARVDFFLVRTNAPAALQLERGAMHDRGSDRIEIFWVETWGDEILSVELGQKLHRVAGDGWTTVAYVLRNPSTREVLLGRGVGHSFSNAPTWLGLLGFPPTLIPSSLEFERLRLRFKLPQGSSTQYDNWLQAAELVPIEITHLGVFSKNIRMEDLVMDRIPGP